MVPCYSTEWKAFTPERWYFYFWSVHEAPLKLFHFCNLLQMPNDYRMLNIEFLGKFLCSCKRISFDDCSQLFMVNFWWPATGILIFAKIPVQNVLNLLQKFLNHFSTICSLSSFWAKCLCCFMTHFKLKLKKSLKFAFYLTSFL